MNCRHCQALLDSTFLDLGFAPPSNAYLSLEDLAKPEIHYPLKLFVCQKCWLVQTDDYAQAEELFSPDYAYFSSASKSWLAHAQQYCQMIIDRLSLNKNSFVIEVASNDGYLLQNFLKANIPCLGIEPTESTAIAAAKIGVPVLQEFFGEGLAKKLIAEGKRADLILGNNVYAHVPDINDFTLGLKTVLKDNGTITLEFPHLMRLIEFSQFDTVYHEHYSYLSLGTVSRIFNSVGLKIFDVELLPTHGGSLRVYGCHVEDKREIKNVVDEIIGEETRRGMSSLLGYQTLQRRANVIKNDFLTFLIDAAKAGKSVAAYGAAAKGCTMLNYAGIKPDLLSYVCDAAPSKQRKYLPGSHIPILNPEELELRKPDFVLILPWNIRDEIVNQLSYIRNWGGKFVTAVPEMQIF